ncbi:phage baseplate assembly protein V [Vibrio brasiliensis]|uniref:phage baseplate assembly protein V n=1 Tax=Vibrio brasiliensis TaxID=170652 RepID=UPI001EFE8D39|nr:phage baseplate assembly protein V [Vibrio brasiliensis]MCG9785395.1 phage baseplate assembly protein V [Vibrio brasiliensis]
MTTNELLLSIIDKVNDLERRVRSLIRIGNVKSVQGRKVVIDYEPDSDSEYYSPPIDWLTIYAGDAVSWRAPTVGEQMIVLNLSGGENERHCVALPALYCQQFLPDTTDPDVMYTSLLDVFRVEVNKQGHYTLHAEESITFLTKGFHVQADEVMSVQTAQYNRVAQTATTKGTHTQTGNVAVKGELDVSMSVKTPAIMSYTAGAFAMDSSGATISNATITTASIGDIPFLTHKHKENGDVTDKPQ